ncbi:MAG: signal recognition particle-docking protein FtsY [Firmicutes bacterium]|nr:signal recognition particle-docking protein FtsY [Alicyclobacillaceae bacterium]MCL6496368.1 signal recognition particle-docking protein FtsY [Bacillota bacterium]
MALWDRLREGLRRTRQGLGDRIRTLWTGGKEGAALFDDLEAVLYEADLGPQLVEAVLSELRRTVGGGARGGADEVLQAVYQILVAHLPSPRDPWRLPPTPPAVWLVVGVNGTGKTTTAAKMAYALRQQGRTVCLGAADTFRAAAVEQLEVWGQRLGVEVIRQGSGADPAAVAFDTAQAAAARGLHAAIIDTAGRLHNKAQLMEELKKVARVVGKAVAGAPHRVWLVLDATTGQNGLAQARVFTEAVAVDGIVLTKLDGTAKGGVALAIYETLGVPVELVGVGEGPEDLLPFDPDRYVAAILGRSGPGEWV